MNYIFIDSKDTIDIIGVVEDDVLVELYMEEKVTKKTLDNIYRGRVETVVTGIDSAFIDIGQEKNAYLHVKQSLPKEYMYSTKDYKIDQVLSEGQDIIVQITKESENVKGAKVSTHIEIKGRYIILTPFSNKVNISKRIYGQDKLKSLKTLGLDIMENDIGLIFRTAARDVDKEIIKEEYVILSNIYDKIERERNFLPSPKLIYKEPDTGYQIIRDAYNEKTDKIIVNSKPYYDDLKLMEDNYPFKFSYKLDLDNNFSTSLNVELSKQIKEALNRKIFLKSGAYLVIDELEAFTAIDVNTGKFKGGSSLRNTALKTNLEASKEIARQIRLRDIGGIIIVDFIDMNTEADKRKLLNTFKEHLQNDRNNANIIDITKLGLVEITRRKTRTSIRSKYSSICPRCDGNGKIFIDI